MFLTLKLIGQQKELFQKSKIKDLVDLVGHSQQLHRVNHGLYWKRKQLIYHNNNSLTVQDHMEVMDVMGDHDLLP